MKTAQFTDEELKTAASSQKKLVNLALQGGGSHGAFTWGVLDALLQDGRVGFEAICGTSAGSMNGALLAYGLMLGGAPTARDLLAEFWQAVGRMAMASPFQPTLIDRMMGNPNLDNSPLYAGFDLMSRMLSPYQFNPLAVHPLKNVLNNLIDFKKLREGAGPKLFVCATNVNRGELRVFERKKMTVEMLLASACLPYLFQAVEVDGEYYWDGGYMGNPSLRPLMDGCEAHDIVVVQVNPIHRESVPHSPTAIMDRINEVSFNASLMAELKGLELINRLLREGKLEEKKCGLKAMDVHFIADENAMAAFSASSKLNADWGFISTLADIGRDAAKKWLATHFQKAKDR